MFIWSVSLVFRFVVKDQNFNVFTLCPFETLSLILYEWLPFYNDASHESIEIFACGFIDVITCGGNSIVTGKRTFHVTLLLW